MDKPLTPEFVRELRRENSRRRLRALDLELQLIEKEIELEARRQGLDLSLAPKVIRAGISVDDRGAVVGAREAVQRAKESSLS